VKTDNYTKAMLTIIAAGLLWMVGKDYIMEEAQALQVIQCQIDEPLDVLVTNSDVEVWCKNC